MQRWIAPKLRRRSENLHVDFHRYHGELKTLTPDERVIAFFDLDRTIISGYSVVALALEHVWSGSLSPTRIIAHFGIFLGWTLGKSDYHDLLRLTVNGIVGLSEDEMIELGERAFQRRLAGLIYPEARQLIDAHKAVGHRVVMVTSATSFQAHPIARELGVDHVLCTELEIQSGVITGKVDPCYGPGKKTAAQKFADQEGLALTDAFFYTDSSEDLALLESVGKPVVANAKTSLSRIALENGWPQLLFESLGESARTDRRVTVG